MKNKKITILMTLMLCACLIAGCQKDTAVSANGDADNVSKDEAGQTETENNIGEDASNVEHASEVYAFETDGIKIMTDMDMSEIEGQLGDPASYYEEPSCAAQGIAKIYTYSGFQIETYPDGDKDLIACIVLKDDSVSTPEGVDLSMTKEDIVAAYGTDYEESETSMTYEKGGAKLCFIMEGEDISSIEYDSPVLN